MHPLNYAPARPAHRRGFSPVTIVGATAALFVAVCILAGAVNQLSAAIMIGAICIGLAAIQPTAAIVIVFIYVSLMGDIRRYIVVQSGTTTNDPLLLVAPAVAVACVVIALVRGRISLQTRASKLIMALMIVMVLEMLNPLQGGYTVGLAGAIFFIVPLLWFWVGQAWSSPAFLEKLLFRVFVPLAVLGSLLGLMQGLGYGYLRYEALWFRMTAESSARPDMRPFSFFCSWAEYAFYVGAAVVVVSIPLLVRQFRLSVLLIPLFAFALIIQSVREPIFGAVIAICLLWAVQSRSRGAIGSRMFIAVVVAGVVMGVGLTMIRDVDVSDAVSKDLAHTTDGFLDVGNSSAEGHLTLAGQGLLFGVTNPIGIGLGGPTMAGGKSGGFSSELDFSDVAIACGIGGCILYLFLLFVIVRSAVVDWRDRRNMIALYALGMMASQPGHILAGGHYAMTVVMWFTIGTFDRSLADSAVARIAPAPRRVGRAMPLRPSLASGARG